MVAGLKTNIYKSTIFVDTNDGHGDTEDKNTM